MTVTNDADFNVSISTAIANGSAAGDLLILRNGNASDEIIVDGAGANDVLTLFGNGSDWTCLALRDN